jgi:DNA-binding NarL/FixJ family response regulator
MSTPPSAPGKSNSPETTEEAPRMMIVDDHPIVRRGVIELLREEFPHSVFGEASSAQQALDLAWKEPWDLILLDISMPGRSGLDVLRDLRQARPEAAILVQSMHSEDQFALRAIKAGAAGYIAKVSLPQDLITAVHKILAGGRYASDAVVTKLAAALSSEGREPLERLSEREFQVLRMLAEGKAVKEIGGELSLSIKTVSTYRTRVLDKLNLRSTAELTQFAMRHGLLE